jgi:L-lactate dehydrogenase complex protein LldG
MATSRDTILDRLRAARQPFTEVKPVADHLPMVPLADTSPGGLLTRFIEQAEKLGCVIYQPASPAEVSAVLHDIIGGDDRVLAWDSEHIPLDQLERLIEPTAISPEPRDAAVRVGITGVDAGLAATGSLVLTTGEGKHRVTSLLPPVHVAILRKRDIVADLESWAAVQADRGLESFRQAASAIVISGPSRTADIAMQLIMGMHGPAELHILLVD